MIKKSIRIYIFILHLLIMFRTIVGAILFVCAIPYIIYLIIIIIGTIKDGIVWLFYLLMNIFSWFFDFVILLAHRIKKYYKKLSKKQQWFFRVIIICIFGLIIFGIISNDSKETIETNIGNISWYNTTEYNERPIVENSDEDILNGRKIILQDVNLRTVPSIKWDIIQPINQTNTVNILSSTWDQWQLWYYIEFYGIKWWISSVAFTKKN